MSARPFESSFPGRAARAGAPLRPRRAGTLDVPGLVRWLPAIALTLLDAGLTYAWLRTGVADEGNPWLAELVATSGPGTAMAVRAALGVGLVALLALLGRDDVSARRGLGLVTGVLGLVLCWHVAGGVMVAFA